ncbi:C-type lectin domain-containing protein [Caenorhabditis elegans]|uniref:C-type lectin domain-containing protein n=1 Tax=Caenorhabditis elegans TaxID=6239 RepID=Q9N3V9_CAEEL|nr:C-type lectin domain-containing protein [Caenorhabditis elegans]CCD71387.1 C-type lectin domain-containing protein [Caenorhabditis elegans]|eukprot:NP_500449.2 C-type LECtin [Caenorhabditis elegans]
MLLPKFLLLTAFLEFASAICADSNDQEIKGFCFKFVTQQLTFTDARTWCHLKNPVGPSYLAYVPSQDTSTYLAFYARSAFGADAEVFWIGLSRNASSGSLSWDNGLPVAYTNFGTNVGKNYFTESISNTKWDTLGDGDLNFFVCSYAPIVNSTTMTSITGTTKRMTTTTIEKLNCKPGDHQIILFAYSNDLAPSVVTDALYYSSLSSQSVTYAVSRFDLRQPEDIQYFSDYSLFSSYVSSHLPDYTLGFEEATTGSNVFEVINKFYDNTQATCGSNLIILSKRYPNTADVSNIVLKVRKSQGMVNFLASHAPSGGTVSQGLYDLCSLTNGIYSIGRDSSFSNMIESMPIRYRYAIYADNPKVSGQGSQTLASMSVPADGTYYLSMMLQNHTPVNTTQSVLLHWYSPYSRYSSTASVHGLSFETNNNGANSEILDAAIYNVTLDFVYFTSETMQIRFYGTSTDHWLPYAD